MARAFDGSAWGINFGSYPHTATLVTETISFWMKTTDTTANVKVFANWNYNTDFSGLVIFLNSTANKITLVGKSGANTAITLVSSTSVNSGSWFHFAGICDRANGGANEIFINGTSEASGNSSEDWSNGFSLPSNIGNYGADAWAEITGDIAEVGHWTVKLTAAEIAALAKGARPRSIRTHALDIYAPLVRDTTNIKSPTDPNLTEAPATTGTTVSDHLRVFG